MFDILPSFFLIPTKNALAERAAAVFPFSSTTVSKVIKMVMPWAVFTKSEKVLQESLDFCISRGNRYLLAP